MGSNSEKILLVDDEPNVLQACQRLLHNRFETDSAVGAAEALIAVNTTGPYAVVLSDMRMPHTDGLQLLSKIKAVAPDTVRIMLTGHADVQMALAAVNEGNIFRILTKPCSKETLINALTAGMAQHRLITSEKDILEKTLSGCLGILTEVLSMASPAAFSRAVRLRHYIGHIATKLSLANRWKFELAAMLSQLGCVTMAPETIDAVYAGQQLSPKEQALYDTHPQIACDLLKNIPRMESVAAMIAYQNKTVILSGDINSRENSEIRMGAELMQAALAFDARVRRGNSRSEAACAVGRIHSDLDPRVMMALVEVEPEIREKQTCTCGIDALTTGMVIEEDVRTKDGLLIIARNQEVTPAVVLKLSNYFQKGSLTGDVVVSVLQAQSAAGK